MNYTLRWLLAVFKVLVYCVLGSVHCSEGQMVNRLSLGTHTALEKVWGGTGGEKPLSHSRPGLSQSWDWWPTDWVWKPFQAHKTSSFSISISEVAAVVGNASANKRHCSVTLSYWCLQKQKKWTSGQGCYDGQMLRFFFFFSELLLPLQTLPTPLCAAHYSWAPLPRHSYFTRKSNTHPHLSFARRKKKFQL